MADVKDIVNKFQDDEKKKILIYNPLSYDVELTYGGDYISLVSKENKYFKTSEAQFMGNCIVDLYLNTKDKNYPREKAEKLVFPS